MQGQTSGPTRGSVDLYMDEYILHDNILHDKNKPPAISVYSCQISAYMTEEVSGKRDSIMEHKKSLSNLQTLTNLVGEAFAYHVDSTYNGPMNHLCKATSEKLIDMAKIFQNHGYKINKVYACNKIGDSLMSYLARHYGLREPVAGDIWGKIVTVCSSKRSDKNWDVHYYVKELAGFVAERRSRDIMSVLIDLAKESLSIVDKHDVSSKKRVFAEIADDHNRMKSDFLHVDIPFLYREVPLVQAASTKR